MQVKYSDITVIGGGPAGYVAAITAAQRQKKVILIEKEELGGTCLNVGCIPTKTLAKTAALHALIRRLEEFGLDATSTKVDWQGVQRRKEEIVASLRQGVAGLLRANNVEVLQGVARLTDRNTVEVARGGERAYEVKSSRIILATGSIPGTLPTIEIDEEKILSSTGILRLDALPQSLLIIGGGVVGAEFASLFQLLGTKVFLVEILPRILPGIDEEIALLLQKQLNRQGVAIWTRTEVERIEPLEKGRMAVYCRNAEGTKKALVEKVLVAVGRKPATSGLGLEKIGVELEGNIIKVNKRMETNIPGIYAAGDVIGGYQLAHVAFAEGEVAALNATGETKEINYHSVPSCIYTHPEVAQVGLTEQEAREHYREFRVGKFPFKANGKALIEGKAAGQIKFIYEPTYGEILGVSIIGPQATELIAAACLAINNEITVEGLVDTMFAHPTISEAMREAGLVAMGRPLHFPK